jgi:plasmid stabilization system protein ParE
VTTFSIHRAALAEIRDAARWYRARSPVAAVGFLDAIDAAIEAIVARPEAWPRRQGFTDVRVFVLARYPFLWDRRR